MQFSSKITHSIWFRVINYITKMWITGVLPFHVDILGITPPVYSQKI